MSLRGLSCASRRKRRSRDVVVGAQRRSRVPSAGQSPLRRDGPMLALSEILSKTPSENEGSERREWKSTEGCPACLLSQRLLGGADRDPSRRRKPCRRSCLPRSGEVWMGSPPSTLDCRPSTSPSFVPLRSRGAAQVPRRTKGSSRHRPPRPRSCRLPQGAIEARGRSSAAGDLALDS
jgi:hypothetical protein